MSDKKKGKTKSKMPTGKAKGRIIKANITEFAQRSLTIYAAETNLERATPDLIDGLKPVARRIVYGASTVAKTKLVKAAQIVGEVMGTYHPHGDSSIYGAMVTMVQSTVPLLHGEGNWGTITDGAAAMRYTNARLSNFGRMGFDPDYANPEVTTYVPNYDERTVEPVSVPYPLPIILFSGAEGIGYGVACSIPSFTPESVADVLKRILKGEKLEPKEFAKAMKPEFKWGGDFVNTKENRQAWLQMFTGTKASVLFESPMSVDSVKREVIISEWPSGIDPEKVIMWARALPETQKADPQGASSVRFVMRKGYNLPQFEAWVKKIGLKTRAKASYNINVTRRTVKVEDGVVDYDVKLHAMSVPQLVMAWLRERLATEIKSLDYRIKKQNEAIAFSDLLIMVANKLDIIIPIIRNSPKPKEGLVKILKITAEQAEAILELKLRRLTKLDQNEISEARKAQIAQLKQLEKWRQKPKLKMVDDIDKAVEAIDADRKWYASKDKQELTLE
jgi:DNA gyrase/topoisomerase IV subunit A